MKHPIVGTEEAEAAAEHNARDVLENGPGLRYGRGSWLVARCKAGCCSLLGGLGSLGVGQMWVGTSKEDAAQPGFETLEVRSNPSCQAQS